MARRTKKQRSGKSRWNIGLMTAVTSINAFNEMGGFEAADDLMKGDIRAAGKSIAAKATLTNVINAAIPIVTIQLIRKTVGQKKLFGPISLW